MHCISVYLVKESDLRGSKVDKILDIKDIYPDIIFTKLKCGLLATPHIPNIREFGKDKMIAKIETDYFGGFGEQSASLYDCNKKIYSESDALSNLHPINDVLKLMGIIANSGMDEFDTIGLVSYRSNADFNHKEYEIGE